MATNREVAQKFVDYAGMALERRGLDLHKADLSMDMCIRALKLAEVHAILALEEAIREAGILKIKVEP